MSQQNSQQDLFSMPNNYLEQEDSGASNNQEDILQQRILSGEYVPEPAEYCNIENELQYNQYDRYQPSFADQQDTYGQIDDPWIAQQESDCIYIPEEYDSATGIQVRHAYTHQPSSSRMVDNPFEEEGPYDPLPTNHQSVRRFGQPPTRSIVITREYPMIYERLHGVKQDHDENDDDSPPPDFFERKVTKPRRVGVSRTLPDEDSMLNKAKSQAAQRLRTIEGWTRFNQWLKKAQETDDREKIINLLETCLEADIPASLLTRTDIDTPKVVKNISRKHPNANVNLLSNNLIKMWKDTISAETKQSKKSDKKQATKSTVTTEAALKTKESTTKDPPGYSAANENLLDILTEAMNKNALGKNDQTTPSTETTEEDRRPRIKAKVKLSTSRRTGLEGDESSTTLTLVGAKKEKSVKKAAATPKQPPPVTKRQLEQSSDFMAAFDDADKKTPAPKKLKINKTVKVVQPNVPDAASTTIKSEVHIKSEHTAVVQKTKETIEQVPVIPRDRGTGILRRTSLTADEKKLRKIRFTDQFDRELVQIRYFDIEEGERINVNKNYDHDRIKRWEMEEEGKQLKFHKGMDSEMSDDVSATGSATFLNPNINKGMPPLPLSGSVPTMTIDQWNLVLLESATFHQRGSKSLLGETETKREQTTMAAFVDPDTPTNAIGEEEDTELILSAENDQPIQIPLILRTGTEKVNEKQEDLVDEYNQPPASTLQLPLPFSSVTGNSHLEFQQNILDNLPPMSPPLITSTTLAPETDKVDAFMDLLKKSAGNQLDDQDLRPSGNGQEDMDQDLRLPPNGDTEELMDYDQLDTPMSPSAESMDTSEPPTTKPASSGGITMDALSTLATLAGKDTGSINLNLVGGLDLAGILSKVESAQQASTTPQIQQHYYAQEDSSLPVIAQIHGEFFQHPNKYNPSHQYHPKGSGTSRSPGVRPTTTNPRSGYFQTPTNMSRYRTVPCKYFLAGTCNFGEACRFLHTTPDGQIVPHKMTEFEEQSSQFEPDDLEIVQEVSVPSFQLALAPKTSAQSIEAASNYIQRGTFRGRRGYRGGFRRGGYDHRSSRTRDRRSPRRYEERRRRHRSKSNSPSSGSNSSKDGHEKRRARRRSRSVSSNEDGLRKRRSPEYDRSPRYERGSPKYDSEPPKSPQAEKERSRSRSLSPEK